MIEKVLGKIKNVDVQLIRGCFLDIDFTFSLEGGGSGVGSGGKYTVNTNEQCKWKNKQEELEAYKKAMSDIKDFLKEAKVDKVSKLKNMPVEVELENRTFKDFKILTEVL